MTEPKMTNTIINISAYKFVDLENAVLPDIRAHLKDQALSLHLKGTILLATEGINLFIAGTPAQLDQFKEILSQYPAFSNLPYKESPSQERPFTRMLVKIKKEIIAMGIPCVKPQQHTATHLSAAQLKEWYDSGKEMIVLDTRNQYEVDLGSFEQALHLKLKQFRDFPTAIQQFPDDYKEKTIVTFCTGGIRCEKAAEYLLQQGYQSVYQLDGGILRYFEEVGGTHYQGECFVFDKRVAVDCNLQETDTTQCFSCRQPLTAEQQRKLSGCCFACENRNATAHGL